MGRIVREWLGRYEGELVLIAAAAVVAKIIDRLW